MLRKLLGLLFLIGTFTVGASAQINHPPVRSGATDPTTCATTDSAYSKLFYNTTLKVWKYCSAANTWSLFSSSALSTLTDVTITSATSGDVLAYNGSAWVNGQPGIATRADNDGTVAIIDTDRGKLVTAGHASANAVSLDTSGAGSTLVAGWYTYFCTTGAGLSTLDPDGSPTINGSTQLLLAQYSCALIISDGSNYIAIVAHRAIRICEVHIWGTGASSVLQDTDDEAASCYNGTGKTETVTSVLCYANAGSPTVLPAVTGGSNLLSGNLTCGTASFAAGSLNGTPTLAAGGSIDDNIVTAGGTATNIRIIITLVR